MASSVVGDTNASYINNGYHDDTDEHADSDVTAATPLLQKQERTGYIPADNQHHASTIGIYNTGHSCYMNSALQFTFAIPEFKDAFLKRADEIIEKSSPSQLKFNQEFVNLTRELYSCSKKSTPDPFACFGLSTGVKPNSFQEVASQNKPEFSGKTQQDSLEYFLHLISLVQENFPENTDIVSPCESFRLQLLEKIERGGEEPSYKVREEYVLSCPISEQDGRPSPETASMSDASSEVSITAWREQNNWRPRWLTGCRNLSNLIVICLVVLLNAAVWFHEQLAIVWVACVIPYIVLICVLFFTPRNTRKKTLLITLCFFLLLMGGCAGFVLYIILMSNNQHEESGNTLFFPIVVSAILTCIIIYFLNREKLTLRNHAILLMVTSQLLTLTLALALALKQWASLDVLWLAVVIFSFLTLCIYLTVILRSHCIDHLRSVDDERRSLLDGPHEDSGDEISTTWRVTLVNCVRQFMRRERVVAAGSADVFKQSRIANYPPYIIIQPRRFVMDSTLQAVKLHDLELVVDETIELGEFASPNDWVTGARTGTDGEPDTINQLPKLSEYRLMAFVTHTGLTPRSGHYTCHVRCGYQWICYDDATVTDVTDPPISSGYYFLYRRMDSIYLTRPTEPTDDARQEVTAGSLQEQENNVNRDTGRRGTIYMAMDQHCISTEEKDKHRLSSQVDEDDETVDYISHRDDPAIRDNHSVPESNLEEDIHADVT